MVLYEDYYPNGSIYQRSNYINGSREGDSFYFRPDSSVQQYIKFWHGSPVSTKDYSKTDEMYNAYATYDIGYYVTSHLKKLGFAAAKGSVYVSFTVTEDGKLIKPQMQMGIDPALDEAIISILTDSRKWVPATLNKKKVEQKVNIVIAYNGKADY